MKIFERGTKKRKPLNMVEVVLSLGIFFIITSTIANFIPWYSQVEPMTVYNKEEPFVGGEHMQIVITRRALIGIEGRVTRELVRLHANGEEEEVSKIDKLISIDRGKKTLSVYYQLPSTEECPQMKPNTYFWRGSMVYKPFGWLEKTYFFRTEKFQIEAKKPDA
jgi:hypothetical protein